VQLPGASGDIVRDSDEENSDLFWGLRAGGNSALLPSSYTGYIASIRVRTAVA